MNFTFSDLFAGIGGMRIAFEAVGGECILTCENNDKAIKTYKHNFKANSSHIFHKDILTLVNEVKVPYHDVLLAGFPCQPYSIAGLRKGLKDVRGGEVFTSILDILKKSKPAAFLLENVKNIKSHDNGKTFDYMISELEKSGYYTTNKILNSMEYANIPQNRERVFIVGFWKNTNFYFPKAPKTETRLGSILQKRVKDKYTISDKLWTSAIKRKERAISKGNGFSYKLFNRDSIYTSTLSARYYKDGLEILVEQKNKNPRRLTPLEARRLQGFPDNFVIPVSDTQAYKQFGNAVPVNVVREIAKNIVAYI